MQFYSFQKNRFKNRYSIFRLNHSGNFRSRIVSVGQCFQQVLAFTQHNSVNRNRFLSSHFQTLSVLAFLDDSLAAASKIGLAHVLTSAPAAAWRISSSWAAVSMILSGMVILSPGSLGGLPDFPAIVRVALCRHVIQLYYRSKNHLQKKILEILDRIMKIW